MEPSDFSTVLLRWYEKNKRDLPWRNTQEAYKIWLSEIILQQTRVQQGLPYYERFIEQFPTIQDLANTSEEEVLRLWQGLGYYSRARHLHQAAQQICTLYQGNFPTSYRELLQIKGIGKYTAAAIASFAFKEKVAVLDGNVYRVLARYFGIDKDISTAEGQKYFAQLAQQLIDERHPDIYNQAIMEFGAIQCKPAQPDCFFCPLRSDCVAYHQRKIDQLPVKTKKNAVKTRFFYYLLLEQAGKYLLKKRTEKDIWKGLHDFPCYEAKKPMLVQNILEDWIPCELLKLLNVVHVSPLYKHVLSHQVLQVTFIHAKTEEIEKNKTWESLFQANFYDEQTIEKLPKPILIHHYLTK
ncbi:MAG: A/G-specific adenine glycosylase [Flammeovirgaceae bacterium]|nr:A/G-specific adenine glycosylase [Flammeovirgaceae bacterium]